MLLKWFCHITEVQGIELFSVLCLIALHCLLIVFYKDFNLMVLRHLCETVGCSLKHDTAFDSYSETVVAQVININTVKKNKYEISQWVLCCRQSNLCFMILWPMLFSLAILQNYRTGTVTIFHNQRGRAGLLGDSRCRYYCLDKSKFSLESLQRLVRMSSIKTDMYAWLFFKLIYVPL